MYLTQSNMASYYHSRALAWDLDRFVSNWNELDNFDVYVDDSRVGIVRFSYNESTTFLRDFQLSTEFQGQGIGSKCLDLIKCHAKNRNSTSLVLRVFSENPAVRLYKSVGFIQVSEVNALIEMALNLAPNT